jgi:type I restriction enzyme, S subunit
MSDLQPASVYCQNVFDGTHDTPSPSVTGNPLITSKHIENGRLNLDEAYLISSSDFISINKRSRVSQWDILFSMIGTVGEVYLETNSKPNYAIKNIGVFSCSNENRARWLYYYLKSPSAKKHTNRHLSGAVQKFLSLGDLRDFPVLAYDGSKEAGIRLVSLIDQKLEHNDKINTKLEAMAKLIFDYWFVQFDFPDENGKPYKSSGGTMVYNEDLKREIPAEWNVDVINNVIDVKDGTHDSPKPQSEGHPLITSKNLKVDGLDFSNANLISVEDYVNINKRSKVDTGDILFSMIGSIGVIYKVDEIDINFAIKNVALYKTSQSENYQDYIYMFLKSYDMQRYMGTVIAGSNQKFIGLGDLRNMPIFIDDKTIKNYKDATNHIFKKLKLIKLENQKLTELRDWLLPMLMNGQVTVE